MSKIKLLTINYLLSAKKGFTLIELIVVIAIIGVFAAGLLATLNPTTQLQKASDSERKSDLALVQRALEQYYNDNNRYPESDNGRIKPSSGAAIEWGNPWSPYMRELPKDPKHPTKKYGYNVSLDGQTYYLFASFDRGGKDPQACKYSIATCNSNPSSNYCKCTNAPIGLCGSGVCNYGASSSNTTP